MHVFEAKMVERGAINAHGFGNPSTDITCIKYTLWIKVSHKLINVNNVTSNAAFSAGDFF